MTNKKNKRCSNVKDRCTFGLKGSYSLFEQLSCYTSTLNHVSPLLYS